MSSQHGHSPVTVDASAGYEKSDAEIKPLVIFALVLVLGTAATIVAMTWLFDAFNAMEASKPVDLHPLAQPNVLPPAPRLQSTPGGELREFNQKLDDTLSSYAWIDQQGGVVRIPVDVALELVGKRGLPQRK